MTAITAPLQMIRAEISVNDFYRWMGGKSLTDPDHAMHCLLTECFGELAPKPFRLIAPRRPEDKPEAHSTGILYGYGTADSEAMKETADIHADPKQCKAMPLSQLESKPVASNWKTGKRLGFEVRIHPTRRVRRPIGNNGKTHIAEYDAFMMQALDSRKETRNREDVYRDWLSERLQRNGGARLESARLKSFQRVRAFRKHHARHIEGPDALMQGTLVIGDPAAFMELLKHGVGRHRAYGYGMLLLKQPGRVPLGD